MSNLMATSIGGIVSVALFYLLVLVVGIWVGWQQKQKLKRFSISDTENIMLAGRDLGLFVGVLTMTATWVAGGYINGTCEGAFTGGIVRASTLCLGCSLSLIVGGRYFAEPMRMGRDGRGYVTMLDPFQEKYGLRVGGLLFLPALLGEIFWSASILSALGSIFSVMLGLHNAISVVVSAAVAVVYTLFGGLYSVAFTDVIQLSCVLLGLTFCAPFVWNHPAIDHEMMKQTDWMGSFQMTSLGNYIDGYLLMILGGIPWQVYFQRILACKSSRQAQHLSYIAGFGCILLAIPPAFLGSVARVADWSNGTSFGKNITSADDVKSILPLILLYLTPEWVSFIGLGAVSAAMMSSADSTVLSSSSMFVHNIYKTLVYPGASELHLTRVMRASIVVSALVGSIMALKVNTIYGLSFLSTDFVYVVLFPQLLLVIHANNHTNTYGCLAGFFTGFITRVLSGEPLLGIPTIIRFPYFDEDTDEQRFPFRTALMVISIVIQLGFSGITRCLFTNQYLPLRYDVFDCYRSKIFVNSKQQQDSLEI